ncbi:response regulator [Aureimonas sp. SK2]|uniref:response regulator n=1 Tax=Aureimonas sp. SK2 TaxID=3015992 RepID=UPI002444BEAE|nr:response regulator [Aureimonas sp. SK2]
MSVALDLQPDAAVTARALLERTDWSATPLGPRATWSPALSIVVDTVLDSQIPKVLMWGPDHVMIYNDGYSEIAGSKHPAAFGGTVPTVWPEIWDWNRRILEAGFGGRSESYRDQPMRLFRNGSFCDVVFDLFYTPIRDVSGAVGGVLCTVIEHTEREAVRHDLRRSNDRFRAAVAAIHSTLWTNSAEGRMSGEQPGWSALTGQTEAEYEGFGWASAVHPDDADASIAAWNEAVATRSTFVFEHRVRVTSGEWRQFAIRAVPIIDEDGTLREWVGVHTDVTEERLAQEQLREHAGILERQIRHRERAEEQLRQLNETLEQRVVQAVEERQAAEAALNRAQRLETVGKLTGGVAHDFNNLLQVVSGNLQLLLKDIAGNERAETRVRNALAGVSRGAKLASQLLAFGRRQALEPKVVNVTRFVRGMDDMLRRAIGEGVEVETVFGGGLWNTFIDPTQIENALLNLAINARDAMDGQGKLTIELGNAHLDDDYARRHEVTAGQYVMLAVSDTGSGMSPEIIERVFEPFFTTKAEGKGSGLGLSMVYGFVKQSGGHVNIYSEVGQGTTIRLYLPRSTEREDQEIEVDTGPVSGGTETVLVVEDDEEVRATAVEMLTDLGYRVLKAVDAQSALNVVESGIPIDILFTDVVMPGKLKSPELARKAKERLPNLAVLFTSGYTENSIVHGGRLDAGVQLLSKPYTREALARKIRHVVANQAQLAVARKATLKGPSLSPAAAEAPATVAAPKSGGTGAGSPTAEAGTKGTVLLVEDDGLIRMNTADMLKDLGYVVVEAGRAEDALTAIQTVPFDALVTDVNLPGMSGTELADEAREVKPGVGVVFATGDRHVAGVVPGEDARVTILSKPYGMEDLDAAIARVLDCQRVPA